MPDGVLPRRFTALDRAVFAAYGWCRRGSAASRSSRDARGENLQAFGAHRGAA